MNKTDPARFIEDPTKRHSMPSPIASAIMVYVVIGVLTTIAVLAFVQEDQLEHGGPDEVGVFCMCQEER